MFGKKKKMELKSCGADMIILGVLILLNDYYSVVTWAGFVGIIAIVAGIKKIMQK